MTKSEAEAQVKEMNKEGPSWFCPLIKGMCVSDCVNFSKAFVWNDNEMGENLRDVGKDEFEVVNHHCHNAMFLESELICPSGN